MPFATIYETLVLSISLCIPSFWLPFRCSFINHRHFHVLIPEAEDCTAGPLSDEFISPTCTLLTLLVQVSLRALLCGACHLFLLFGRVTEKAMGLSSIASYVVALKHVSHAWLNGNLLVTLPALGTRNVFTTCFVIINLAITFLGGLYINKRNQRHLLDGAIPVSHLTPWMSLGGVFSYAKATRQLPGGAIGFLMLVLGLFSLSSQYFVNSFIESESIQSRCNFTQGLITTINDGRLGAVVDWPAADLAMQAQLNAVNNGGDFGIYDKVINDFSPDGSSADITNIWPDPGSDVLGSWVCNTTNVTTIEESDTGSLTAFDAYLSRLGLQSSSNNASEGRLLADGTPQGLLEWSTEEAPPSNQSLPNVRTSIWDNTGVGQNPNVSTIKCVMRAYSPSWIPPVALFENNTVLQNWTNKAVGDILGTDPEFWDISLMSLLNTMVMTAGAGNLEAVFPSVLSDYGCSVDGSLIRWQMWLISGLLIGTLKTLLVLYLYSLWSYRRSSSDSRNFVEQLPADVLNWQLATIRHETRDKITPREVELYRYGLVNDEGMLGIRKYGVTDVSPTPRHGFNVTQLLNWCLGKHVPFALLGATSWYGEVLPDTTRSIGCGGTFAAKSGQIRHV